MPRFVLFVLALTLLAGCDAAGTDEPQPREAPSYPSVVAEEAYTVTESGLKYFDLEEGDGDIVEAGDVASVHYTGWLTDSTRFDSSLPRGRAFVFQVGAGRVISGWDEGVVGMREGGLRQLVLPPALAYGASGYGSIPPNATLIFEVELLEVR